MAQSQFGGIAVEDDAPTTSQFGGVAVDDNAPQTTSQPSNIPGTNVDYTAPGFVAGAAGVAGGAIARSMEPASMRKILATQRDAGKRTI